MEPAFIRYIILLWLHTSIDISLSASHPSPPVTPAYSVSNKINAYTLGARGNRVTVSRQWPPYVKLELHSISRTKRASPPRTLANAPRRRISSFMEAAVYVFSRILFIKLTSNFQVWGCFWRPLWTNVERTPALSVLRIVCQARTPSIRLFL